MTINRPHPRPASLSKKAASAAAFLATLGVTTLDAVPAGALSLAPTTSNDTLELPAEFNTYLESDYTYYDAEALAEIWGLDEVYDAKIKLGTLLQAGADIPIEPGSTQPVPQPVDATALALDAFWASDYAYQDALELAEYWGLENPYDAKIKMGTLLKAGYELPIEPGEMVGPFTFYNEIGYTWGDAEDLAAYWGIESTNDAKYKAAALLEQGHQLPLFSRQVALVNWEHYGYGWGDAVELSAYWGLDHPNDAMFKAGRLLKAGTVLPNPPQAASWQRFVDEGYTWADSMTLANYWGLEDENDAKIKAGRLLKAGVELPSVVDA